MLTDFQKQVVLFTKGHYGEHKEIDLKAMAAVYFDLSTEYVRDEQVVNMLFPIFDILLTNISRIDMMYGMFKSNRINGGNGRVIELKDTVSYLVGEISCVPVLINGVDTLELGEKDDNLLDDMLKCIERSRPYSNM